MKNNKGFTLVEIISVIVLLGLVIGIAVPSVMNASTNVKKKTLQTKVDNIEQAAVLYGQNNDNRELINYEIKSTYSKTTYKYCFKKKDDGTYTHIKDCYYYKNNSFTTITVGDLKDAGYIKDDEGTTGIWNSVDDTKSLLDCKIQIYKKYNKIYAVYLAKDTDDETCWYK